MPRPTQSSSEGSFTFERRRFAASALALALVVTSCVSSPDSLYDAPEPPRTPVRPDAAAAAAAGAADVAACETCATEECSDERTACLQDADCLAVLECRGDCSDPTCVQACTAHHGYSPWYEDFWSCVMTDHCATACGTGTSFACVDDYDAPHADQNQASFPVRFHYKNPRTGLAYAYPGDERDEEFVVGAHARSCLPPDLASSECQRIDEDIVGADDSVELDLVVHPGTRAFRGVVEVSLDDDAAVATATAATQRFQQLGWRDRYLPPPFTERTEFRFYVFWRGWFREKATGALGEALDFSTAAPLAVYFEDCLGSPASGVRIELPDLPDVPVLNQASDGSVGDETDTGSALIGDIPESARDQALVVQAVDVESGEVLARRNDVFVRPGWTTHVWLMPSPAH